MLAAREAGAVGWRQARPGLVSVASFEGIYFLRAPRIRQIKSGATIIRAAIHRSSAHVATPFHQAGSGIRSIFAPGEGVQDAESPSAARRRELVNHAAPAGWISVIGCGSIEVSRAVEDHAA